MTESNNERLERIKKAPLGLITEGLSDMDVVTDCVVDYRDYLWLIEQTGKNDALEHKAELLQMDMDLLQQEKNYLLGELGKSDTKLIRIKQIINEV